MTSGPRGTLLRTVSVATLLVLAASAVAVGAHLDSSDGDDVTELTVHTYDDPAAEQRRPGATDRSYWTESITFGIPEDEPVYLTETVTYRPIPSDCAAADTEEFGIDRDNTAEGERRIDDSATESVKAFSKDADARDRYEAEYGEDGALATTDWAYVERLEVQWYDRDDFGAPLEVYRGDRFVSAQRDCLDNPDVAGWYRIATINQGELENGTRVEQDTPTFSHWFYICDCASREAAIDQLGPPPSEAVEATPTATAGTSGDPTPTATDGGTPVGDSADDETGTDPGNEAGPTPDGPTPSANVTPDDTERPVSPSATTPTRSQSGDAASPTTPTADWDDRVLRTPTAAPGTGFTPLVGLIALLAAGAAVHRR